MKQTRAKRKLLSPKTLSRISLAVGYGVPMARAIRDLDLDMSRTAVANLLRMYKKHGDRLEVNESLFPPWLDKENDNEQINPDGWVYVGRFPWGYWQNENN